MMMNKKDV
ncbi:hypothetical protein CGLO_03623 [Colletotrichum gloeosporioides Cg-14]|uniref:Uncharacterized protein n=1 Tax=Colletotrichum gloeosporioides (strain Cg-14) TaxID=1237896 RepID=T0M666_COLGC|nr:hypothetical protein CGLO_03623 [Colletotrichum gloeosporioides Cg-14]